MLLEGYFTVDVDETVIRRFLTELPAALGLRTYGEPTVFAPGGSGRESNEGYDAFIPLIDSGVSLYVWSSQRFLAVVLFTCKRFDAEQAIEFTRNYFTMTDTEHQEF
ncbi:MAG: S-adenosylmethionine decarboxylase [Actinomycetia bacterium]|nr:S-adenosylmethionine decarboxylase [Actinomycetes bacterium]